jgi:hypothetical protein
LRRGCGTSMQSKPPKMSLHSASSHLCIISLPFFWRRRGTSLACMYLRCLFIRSPTEDFHDGAEYIFPSLLPPPRRGVVHRDLKPSNCILTGYDKSTVKIIDFGLARSSPPFSPQRFPLLPSITTKNLIILSINSFPLRISPGAPGVGLMATLSDYHCGPLPQGFALI